MSGPLLFLDDMPWGFAERGWTEAKIFLKEGVRHGDWPAVFRNRRVGASAVVPSAAAEGLRGIGRQVVRNDFGGERSYDLAWVYKDPRALRWALAEKRAGRIGKLLAGPMVVNLPSEAKAIMSDPGVDAWCFASPWIRDLFLRRSPDPRPAHIAFSGIDEDYWAPKGPERDPDGAVLVYRKTVEQEIYPSVMAALAKRGLPVVEIGYGSYDHEGFRRTLSRARAAVFLSRTETQGLAMFEAWSMDVPTLHWDPGIMHYLGHRLPGASSCPYLTPECGRRFTSVEELPGALDQLLLEAAELHPRATVLSRFTAVHAARRAERVIEAVALGERPLDLE